MSGDRRTRAGASKPTTDALIGRTLDGRYLIQEKIARGGMATVYVAHDNRLQRTVALKVMHPGMGDDDTFSARFVREARSAAQLDHPSVVAVYDQGEDNGTLFLTMELVRGKTLRDLIGHPMPPAKALAYLEPVLAALAAAHRAGIVHRDVKPENVLIAPAAHGSPGRIKVADFGLARAVTAETQHTSTGTIIGTVSYLAPELVERGNADARVDVYAAGVVLYEMLTGSKPHQGETPIQVAYKHVHEDIPAPSASVPGIPPYVDALVARTTARNPANRFTNAGEFLANLHKVARTLASGAADDPELTAELNLGARLPEATAVLTTGGDATVAVERTQQRSVREEKTAARKKKRRGLVAIILAALLAIGLGVGAGWWLLFGRYTHAPDVEGMTLAAAQTSLEQAGFKVVVSDQKRWATQVDTHRWSKECHFVVCPGAVVATEPAADARVVKGATITLFPSLGRNHHKVPNVVKQTLQAATNNLAKNNNFVVKSTEDWSDTIPANSVISSNPQAGSDVYEGDTVNLVVSKGQEPITLSDYTGAKVTDAKVALDKLKLKTNGSTKEFSTTVPAGVIIRQSPEDGAIVHHGDTITFVVSKGPPVVAVPSIRGMSWNQAVATLKAVGINATPGNAAAQAASAFFPTVALAKRTDPKAGETVPVGSTVRVLF